MEKRMENRNSVDREYGSRRTADRVGQKMSLMKKAKRGPWLLSNFAAFKRWPKRS